MNLTALIRLIRDIGSLAILYVNLRITKNRLIDVNRYVCKERYPNNINGLFILFLRHVRAFETLKATH